jgi:DivIVA domain-containing protein
MTDLTPQELRKKRGRFRRVVWGYEPGEVDALLGRVANQLNAHAREIRSLQERCVHLETQLREWEARESGIQETLVFAHTVSDQTVAKGEQEAEALREQASQEVDLMKAEAEAQIALRMDEAEDLLQGRKEALKELERISVLFLRSSQKLLNREISTAEPEAAPEGEPDFDVPEENPEELTVGRGPGRAGAFDYMVTSVSEEALPELFGQLLEGSPQEQEGPAWRGRAEEDGEEDTH